MKSIAIIYKSTVFSEYTLDRSLWSSAWISHENYIIDFSIKLFVGMTEKPTCNFTNFHLQFH